MTDNQSPRPTPPAAEPRVGTPEGDRAFVRRTVLRRQQRNRRIFSVVIAVLMVLAFVVFLVTEFMMPPTHYVPSTPGITVSAFRS